MGAGEDRLLLDGAAVREDVPQTDPRVEQRRPDEPGAMAPPRLALGAQQADAKSPFAG